MQISALISPHVIVICEFENTHNVLLLARKNELVSRAKGLSENFFSIKYSFRFKIIFYCASESHCM